MEFIFDIVSFVIGFVLLLVPILILLIAKRKKLKVLFWKYLLITVAVTVVVMIIFSWWSSYSNVLKLESYGYNLEASSKDEALVLVESNDVIKVEELLLSINGIGWQISAVVMYIIYFPYIFVIYILYYFIYKNRMSQNKR